MQDRGTVPDVSDEQRKPTAAEVVRDRPRSPTSLDGEGGPHVEGTESSYRQRGGTIEDPPEHGYRLSDVFAGQSLGGEDMGPDERDDADVLREEDVTEGDRLSDDVREADHGPAGLPVQGEDMPLSSRVDAEQAEESDS